MILVIDNYDSFTWNLVHYLRELGTPVAVVRNDEVSVAEAMASDAAVAVARTRDGRTVRARVDHAVGSVARPMTRDQLAKYERVIRETGIAKE